MENLNYDNEIWKDIPEFNGLYQASNMGRIRSVDRYVNNPHNTKSFRKGKILKQTFNQRYYYVSISYNNKQMSKRVHRLIAFAFPEFCGEWFKGAVVDHKDGNTKNNFVGNIEWVTPLINYERGNSRDVTKQTLSKKVVCFDLNGNYICDYDSAADAGRALNKNHSHITECCRGVLKQAYGFKWQYKQ